MTSRGTLCKHFPGRVAGNALRKHCNTVEGLKCELISFPSVEHLPWMYVPTHECYAADTRRYREFWTRFHLPRSLGINYFQAKFGESRPHMQIILYLYGNWWLSTALEGILYKSNGPLHFNRHMLYIYFFFFSFCTVRTICTKHKQEKLRGLQSMPIRSKTIKRWRIHENPTNRWCDEKLKSINSDFYFLPIIDCFCYGCLFIAFIFFMIDFITRQKRTTFEFLNCSFLTFNIRHSDACHQVNWFETFV